MTHVSPPLRRRGFTLVELLVVVAIIMLLLMILVPALNRVRQMGKASVCTGNHKTLVAAWWQGALDRGGKLIRACPSGNNGWINGWGNNPDNIRNAKFYDLVGGTMSAYRCPEETRPECIRSYSISDRLAGYAHYPEYRAYTTATIWKPTKSIVFTDEFDPRNYNVGTYVTDSWRWIDFPPPSHMEGSVFSFVDGHTETYKYASQETADITWFYHTPKTPEAWADHEWVWQHYLGKEEKK